MKTLVNVAAALALTVPAFGAPVEMIREGGEPTVITPVTASVPTMLSAPGPILAIPPLREPGVPHIEANAQAQAMAAGVPTLAASPIEAATPRAERPAPSPLLKALGDGDGGKAGVAAPKIDFDGDKGGKKELVVAEPAAPVTAYQPPKGYELLDADQRSKSVEEFEKFMKTKVVDQDKGVDAMVRLFQRIDAGLSRPGRPLGNVMFLGPTGSGKTHLFEMMAEYMFGDRKAMLKIDGAEFMHSHEVAKLIGSPPGYLGHRETHPLLTQEALNQWHNDKYKVTILLFDEIEKASDAVWNLLLGIMDKATLTLGDNRKVDFQNVIIGFTSNVGAQQMQNLLNPGLGFTAGAPKQAKVDRQIEEVGLAAMRSKFSPEFLNRIDEKSVFKAPTPASIAKILDLQLQETQDYFDKQVGVTHFKFVDTVTPSAKRLLTELGFDKNYGARPLKRTIERLITNKFANMIKTGQIKDGDQIIIDTDGPNGTKLVFLKKKGLIGSLVDQVRK